jgi:hypothetical protein
MLPVHFYCCLLERLKLWLRLVEAEAEAEAEAAQCSIAGK